MFNLNTDKKLENKINILLNKLTSIEDKKEFKAKRRLLRKWTFERLSKLDYKRLSEIIKKLSADYFTKYRSSTTVEKGFICGVYIIKFSQYEDGIYKIGFSTNINERIKTLQNTSVLGTVQLIKYYPTVYPKSIERIIHQELNDYRIQSNREFFKGDLDYFCNVIEKCINNYQSYV